MTDTQKLLNALQSAKGEWVGNLYRDLNIMVHSRAADLRKEGYKVEARRFSRKDWRYRMVAE